MGITLVQSPGGNASTINSPTSLVCSWGATSAGNLLILMVSATGSSPTVTTPGGWTALGSNPGTSISTYLFTLANNAGGLTGVTLACSATNGGISASFFEFSGMPAANNAEYTNTFSGTGTAVPQLVTSNVQKTDELCLAFVASNATASLSTSGSRTPEWVGNVNGIGSTNATTNTRNNTYYGASVGTSTPFIQGTLSVSVVWSAICVRLLSSDSGPFSVPVIAIIGGNAGQVAGQFFQGMVGG
jgi:hypothetical protein